MISYIIIGLLFYNIFLNYFQVKLSSQNGRKTNKTDFRGDSNYDDENNSDFEDHVEMRLKSNPEQEEDSDSEVEDRRTSSVYYCNSKKNRKTG